MSSDSTSADPGYDGETSDGGTDATVSSDQESTGAETNGATTDGSTDAETNATVSSDYKVRGKKAATSGAGVLGHNTATSGEAYGVEGVTDSSDINAAAVRAIANNGGEGISTTADGNYAVDAFTSGYTAIDGTTDGKGYNGVKGENNATSGYSWGVRGDTESAHFNAHGVKGYNNNSNGSGNGVSGTTYGSGDGATGVHGEAVAGSGQTYGVGGVTNSSDTGAVGVRGSTTEANHGVLGQAYDDESNLPSLNSSESAGVFGRNDKSGYHYGIVGWSKNSHGILARSDDSNSAGIIVLNSSGGPGIQVNQSHVTIDDHIEVGGGTVHRQRSDPSTADLNSGEVMTYNSDGSGTGNAGDLVYAVNDGGTIKTKVIVQRSNATA